MYGLAMIMLVTMSNVSKNIDKMLSLTQVSKSDLVSLSI